MLAIPKTFPSWGGQARMALRMQPSLNRQVVFSSAAVSAAAERFSKATCQIKWVASPDWVQRFLRLSNPSDSPVQGLLRLTERQPTPASLSFSPHVFALHVTRMPRFYRLFVGSQYFADVFCQNSCCKY